MKAEGVTAGVADIILLIPSGGYASLCMEFKTEKGRQQETQKLRGNRQQSEPGNKYAIIRSFDDFRTGGKEPLTSTL